MLLTNKADILTAMNEELAGASPSSIKWLKNLFCREPKFRKEEAFGSVLPDEQIAYPVNVIYTPFGPKRPNISMKKTRAGRRIATKKIHSDKIILVNKPLIVSVNDSSNFQMHYMLKLNLHDIMELEKQNKAVPLKMHCRKRNKQFIIDSENTELFE